MPLTSRRAAIKARETAIIRQYEELHRKAPVTRKTVQEVCKEYCERGRSGKPIRPSANRKVYGTTI